MARPSYTNKYPNHDDNSATNSKNLYQKQYETQKQYQTQSVMTMTQGEMLFKLYDEIIKQLNIGIDAIDENPDVNTRNTSLIKAQKILNHLRINLNFEYDISNSLYSLYEFFIRYIVEANLKNESELLIEILPLIEDLRDTYLEAEKQLKLKK